MDELFEVTVNDPEENRDPETVREYVTSYHEFCTGDPTCKNALVEILACAYENLGNLEICKERYVLQVASLSLE